MLAVFFNAVSTVIVLLLLVSVGYLMAHLGWMGESEKKFVGQYLMNIAVPCSCLTGLLNNLDRSMLTRAGFMLVACILGVIVNFAIGMAVATLMKIPRQRWGVFVSMLALPNSLFIGLPVCTQLFGDVCVPYVMVYYLSNTIFTQTAALVLEVRPPEFIMSFAQYISGSVSALALIYCGCVMFKLGLKNVRLHHHDTGLLCHHSGDDGASWISKKEIDRNPVDLFWFIRRKEGRCKRGRASICCRSALPDGRRSPGLCS